MNVIELNFSKWCKENCNMKNEIDNLKKLDDERLKEIETLNNENEALKEPSTVEYPI